MSIDHMVNTCLKTNNIYPDRHIQEAGQLSGKCVEEFLQLEDLKVALVLHISGQTGEEWREEHVKQAV